MEVNISLVETDQIEDKIKIIRVTNSFFREFLIEKGIVKEKILQIPLTVNKIFKKV